jgi:hypothetical protein
MRERECFNLKNNSKPGTVNLIRLFKMRKLMFVGIEFYAFNRLIFTDFINL